MQDGEYIRVTINATLADGTKVQNRKTFLAELSASVPDATALIAIDTWVETLYGFLASEIDIGATLEQGSVDAIGWNPADSIWEVVRNVGIYDPLDTFANASEPLPNQCAAFCVASTYRPKTKGRIFAFPFGEDRQAQGVLIGAAITALTNFAAQYILPVLLGASGELVSGVVREYVDAWYPFTSVEIGDTIGTQRRRRPGVGV